jgi:hypothetical protein
VLGGVPSAFHFYALDFAGVVKPHGNKVVRHIVGKREVKAVQLVIAAPMSATRKNKTGQL